jgi:putative FmdB family regulatory protein
VPTYEYTCRDCGHTFEIVQSMWDEPLTMCPECGGSLRKVFAPPAISFKGSGFYATDHGKKAKRPSETAASSKEGGSEPSESSKEPSKGSSTDGTTRKDGTSVSKKEPAAS